MKRKSILTNKQIKRKDRSDNDEDKSYLTSPEYLRIIREAREDIKNGDFISFEDLQKQANLDKKLSIQKEPSIDELAGSLNMGRKINMKKARKKFEEYLATRSMKNI